MFPRIYVTLALYIALSGVVLFNILYLQGVGRARGPRVEQAAGVGEARPQPLALPAPDMATSAASDTIRAVQRELDAKGYGIGKSDGLPGIVTRAAVFAYEAEHGLPLSADPGEDLLRIIVLGSAEAVSSPQGSSLGPHAVQLVRTVQQTLMALGHGPAKVDGQNNEDTVAAISRFEREQGLASTGRISAPMVARLMRLAAQVRPAK